MRWALLCLLGAQKAAGFGGLNQLSYDDAYRLRNEERQHNLASVGTQSRSEAEYSNGHFDSEYPSDYIINTQNADMDGNVLPSAVSIGRQLSSSDGAPNTEGALLEAAKAAEAEPAVADEIGTPALLTEV